MSTLDWSKRLRGICAECGGVFCLTTKAKVWGHSCGGAMKYSLDPIPESVETWGEYYDKERDSNSPARQASTVDGAGVPYDELRAWLDGAVKVVQELAQKRISVELPVVRIDSQDCLNCGSEVPEDVRYALYCTKFCQLTAESIRYHRRVLADGRYKRDPLVRDAVAVVLQKLSQGVVVRRNKIPPEVRKRVFDRTGGFCAMPDCDRPATDLDHIEGRGYGDVESNLQALCNPCHLQKSKTDAKALSDEMIRERRDVIERGLLDGFLRRYAVRVFDPSPHLICDDPDEWPLIYRQVAKVRRQLRAIAQLSKQSK